MSKVGKTYIMVNERCQNKSNCSIFLARNKIVLLLLHFVLFTEDFVSSYDMHYTNAWSKKRKLNDSEAKKKNGPMTHLPSTCNSLSNKNILTQKLLRSKRNKQQNLNGKKRGNETWENSRHELNSSSYLVKSILSGPI